MNILQATSHPPLLPSAKPWVDTTHPLAVIGARRFLSLPYYQAKTLCLLRYVSRLNSHSLFFITQEKRKFAFFHLSG